MMTIKDMIEDMLEEDRSEQLSDFIAFEYQRDDETRKEAYTRFAAELKEKFNLDYQVRV